MRVRTAAVRVASVSKTSVEWTRQRYRRTPLRVKLVATLLLLVVAALAASGAVGVATLRSYLVGRVDSQLRSAQNPIIEHELGGPGGGGHGGGRGGPDGGDGSRLPSEFVVAITDANGALVYGPTSDLVDPDQPLPNLPHATGAETKANGSRTFTVDAVQGNGQWRVLANPYQMSNGTTGTLLIAQSLGPVDSTIEHLVLLSLIIGAATVIVLAGIGYLIVRASLRPLREVERTAANIAAGDLSHRVPDADPRTEVGQLSRALNTMLGEIEIAFAERAASEQAARMSEAHMRRSEAAARESEQRMRRFVADASHELRTPLTSIRGFAELYRQGAASDEQDLRRLMQRIEDEAKRMGVLVEDLLLLARLDQERPLARRPVDLLALATDAVHDARAVDPERPITLEVGPTDPPPVVAGDEARLRQVLSNLVMNALKHTPSDTPVSVRVATETSPITEPRVVLEVADHGPGMDRDDAAHVFERFYRADKARRTEGGTGLGLAIVSALVAGHGGRVAVRTAPGAGATFRVELPLAGVPAPA
jgi:two-component system, OmpR family, sensor kinase